MLCGPNKTTNTCTQAHTRADLGFPVVLVVLVEADEASADTIVVQQLQSVPRVLSSSKHVFKRNLPASVHSFTRHKLCKQT